jgi:hypothetical protein
MKIAARRLCTLLLLAILAFFATATHAQVARKISTDTFTNTDSTHKTEVEPDTFAWGSTIVSAFHVGRRPSSQGWGSADVGFATSTNGGTTWRHGILPGLTVYYKAGAYFAAADPSVAYDARHGQWLISTLPLAGLDGNNGLIGDVAVSRSTDGIHWGNPILIDTTHLDDKNWTVCDNTTTSAFYGNCYTQWDQAFGTGDILMSTSSDGGLTWGPGLASADHAGGLGGQPLVQPNGTVIVPFESFNLASIRSTDGGKTWNRSVSVANITDHVVVGLRNPNLPSAEIDKAGKVYLVWDDCRFRAGCTSNDIVMSTSTDGNTWSAPVRIPIDAVNSTVDHFIPGIGVDPATSGATAHLTIAYYYYPVSNCGNSCQLFVGFTTSTDGGQTWTAGKKIAGPMQLSWLPVSDNGPMVADYISVSYVNGNPFGVFAVAKKPAKGLLNEGMYTTKTPLVVAAGERRFSSRHDKPVPNAKSDHVRHAYYDDAGHFPIPESRRVPDIAQP